MGPNILNSRNTLADLKGLKGNIICTMADVQRDVLRPPHGTTPAAVINIRIKLRSLNIFNEKGDGPYRGFGYLSLFSDPINSTGVVLGSWGCLLLPRGYIHVYDHNIQTSSSLKPLGQSKPKFMWNIVRKEE